MKNNLKFLIAIFSFLSVLVLQNCTPKEELPATPIIWEKAAGLGDYSLLNSRYINNKLMVMSATGIFSDASLTGPNEPQSFGLVLQRPDKYKYPISEKVLAFRNEYQVLLVAPKNVGLWGKEIVFTMRDLDPGFQYFFNLPYFFGDALGVDGNGTVLVPYHSATDGKAKSSPDFLMIKTRLINGELEILETNLIKENYVPGMSGVFRIVSFENFFQLNIGPYTYNIGANEVPELKYEFVTKSFTLGNEIITFGAEQGTSILHAYRSDLNGQNSTLINTYPDGASLLDIEFTEIDGKIIGYQLSQFSLVELTENEILIKELDNTGLEGGWITSITKVGGDNVLVTLSSSDGFDRNGGYFKSIGEFFKEK